MKHLRTYFFKYDDEFLLRKPVCLIKANKKGATHLLDSSMSFIFSLKKEINRI